MRLQGCALIIAICVAAIGAAQAQSIGSPGQGLTLARAQCARNSFIDDHLPLVADIYSEVYLRGPIHEARMDRGIT
jgi:hypothetical protein